MLPTSDHEESLYHGLGSGMYQRPRKAFFYGLVQLPGVVAVVTAAMAGSAAAIVLMALGGTSLVLPAGLMAFAVTVVILLAFWQRSVKQIRSFYVPMYPAGEPAQWGQ